MRTVLFIPARYGSSRFPGKSLTPILGRSLLERTWRLAKSIQRVDEIYIATDDTRIQKHAHSFGAATLMTRTECLNGTERIWDAVQGLVKTPEICINLQGDAVLTPPWVIQSIVDHLQQNPKTEIATPAVHLDWNKYDQFLKSRASGKTSGTFVVFNKDFQALYFSKAPIPHIRDRSIKSPPLYRHIGIYGYRLNALKKYMELSPSPLETIEQLEQLRALENGIPIKILLVDYQGRTHGSIDNPEDISVVEEIIRTEGELIP